MSSVSNDSQIAQLLNPTTQPTDYPIVSADVVSSSLDHAILTDSTGRSFILPSEESIHGITPELGEKVTALVINDHTQPAIVSLTHPGIIGSAAALFVPELRTGQLRIMSYSRIPGVRAKIAVASTTPDVDPLMTFLGRRANRIKALTNFLKGERIDAIVWHGDREQFLKNAFAPAEVSWVKVFDREAVVAVPGHLVSSGVGEGGLNSALAGRLTGYHVSVVNADTTTPDTIVLEDVLSSIASVPSSAH